jgi:hypothetical protein
VEARPGERGFDRVEDERVEDERVEDERVGTRPADLPVAARPDARAVPRPDVLSWGRPPEEDIRAAMMARLRDRPADTQVPRRRDVRGHRSIVAVSPTTKRPRGADPADLRALGL